MFVFTIFLEYSRFLLASTLSNSSVVRHRYLCSSREIFHIRSRFEQRWSQKSSEFSCRPIIAEEIQELCRFILIPIDYTALIRDTRWSLIFGANIQQYIDGSDYWAQVILKLRESQIHLSEFQSQVNDSPILLHMWSLGAEVQYYLAVPLIVMVQRCSRQKNNQLIFLGFLAIGQNRSFTLFT